jgi:hypothetical protein
MTLERRRPGQPAALEIASIRADFEARLDALREAAEAWGVQPYHPEGIFLSAMVGTQAGFADLALSTAEVLHQIVTDAHATAEDELARQRVITERTRQTLAKASGSIDRLERNGHLAVHQI